MATTRRALLLPSLLALGALTSAAGCIGEDPGGDEAADSASDAITPGKTYRVLSVGSGMALDVNGQSKSNGAAVQQWTDFQATNQQWKLVSAAGGTYELVSVNSGKCLDVTGQSKADGAKLQQWSCAGSDNQRWTLKSVGGNYEIIGAGSGKCLDVTGQSKSDGARVQQWGCWGGDNQLWKLVEVGASSGGGGGGNGGKTEYAPYFYTWAWGAGGYPFKSLVDLKNKAGTGGITLAFVLSNGGCSPTTDVQDHLADVKAFKAQGGLVKASFGGASGTYLEAKCGSAGSLAGAIGAFVDQTGIADLDFDVEQGGVMTTSMNKKRGQALKQLQDQKGVKVAFTLPVMPWGMDGTALDVISQAAQAGVTISHVNLMVMDYGPSYTGSMGGYAKQALDSSHGQLMSTISGLSDTAAWRMLGATPMIGKNDQSGEVFTLADAQTLVSYAQQKQLGLLAFWAINRDQPGGGIDDQSGVNSKSFQFNDVFKAVQ